MTDLVMISGKQGSGKSTLSEEILRLARTLRYTFYGVLKFAAALYEMHDFIINKISSYVSQHGEIKAIQSLPQLLHDYVLNKMFTYTGVKVVHNTQLLAFFEKYVFERIQRGDAHLILKDGPLLQYLGTEFGRNNYGDNVWVDIVLKQVRKYQEPGLSTTCLVIDDCRFENEFDAFPEALRVRLECPADVRKARMPVGTWRDKQQHPSEIGLDSYAAEGRFDLTFHTDKETTEHCASMLSAQLQKRNWFDKRCPVAEVLVQGL